MTPYDAWRTNVEDTRQEDWEEAVDTLACSKGTDDCAEWLDTLAMSDEVLHWVCGAVTIPDVYLHSFRDLVKLSHRLRKEVESEMKANRKYPDAD